MGDWVMDSGKHWGRTILWGAVTGILYTLLFSFTGEILHLAHTTPDACLVPNGAGLTYLHNITPDLCTGKGGTFSEGHWYHALVPILIAFAISYTHGAFTGLFWDSMGLKAAGKK